nr:reverse transcriptase domain-containing protein [Tanacetum cinerariifolium]
MADQRTMAELLRAPTEGYAEAIVVSPILAKHFELKHSLINMMTSDQFFGLEKENPHDHIRWFNKITFTIKYKDVPNSAIKLMLFPFSLTGAARLWLEKEPPRSILTWEDLVSKFIIEFFPPSRTANLQNEISNFQQRIDKSFHEAWDRYKYLLRDCPHHGLIELHQLDTFYNTLNPADRDSLNSAVGGNLLERRTQDVLTIIKNKSKQTSAMTTAMTTILKQFQATPPPASVKAVKEICINCGGAHPYYQCLATDGNTFLKFWDNIQGYVSAAAVNYNQGELKSITTRSGLILDGPFIPMPPPFINPKEDERVEETLTDPDLAEPFLRTAHALIDVHGEEMILRDADERLTLNMRHDTSSYSNQPQKESLNMINIYNDSCKDYLEDLFATNHLSGNLTFSSHIDLTSSKVINTLSGNPTSSSPNYLLEEFADELALITFPRGNDDLPFDIESDLRVIEYLLNHDPTKEMDSILEDSVDEGNLADPNNDVFDTIPKIDFLPALEYDSFLFEDFSEVDALPSTNNEDKVFNLGILIQENLSEVTVQVTPDKNVKKISISNASLILKDFDPLLSDHELPFHKEVLGSETLLSFSFENEKQVFKPRIFTSKGVHTSLLLELSHRGLKAFKVIKIFEGPMEIFPCSYGEDIRILDVSCLYFYPSGTTQFGDQDFLDFEDSCS